jgi:hypothetical protein
MRAGQEGALHSAVSAAVPCVFAAEEDADVVDARTVMVASRAGRHITPGMTVWFTKYGTTAVMSIAASRGAWSVSTRAGCAFFFHESRRS